MRIPRPPRSAQRSDVMLATLRSNDGASELALQFEARTTYATEARVEASVRLRGEHSDGDHTHPLDVSIETLCLRMRELRRLHETLIG